MGFGQPRGSRNPRQQVTRHVFPTPLAPSQSASAGGPTIRPGVTAQAPTGVEMRRALMELFGVRDRPELHPFVALSNAPMGGNRPAVNPMAALSNGLMGGGGLLAQGLLSAIFRRMMGGW